jgi:hypothetical protein
MDLARLRGMSLADATALIGKVYSGNVGILRRYGIQLKAGATATDALREIQKRAAGQAEAFAGTIAGRQKSLDIALDNLRETIGGMIIGPFADITGWLSELVSPGGNGKLSAVIDEWERFNETIAETKPPDPGDWAGTGTFIDSFVDGLGNVADAYQNVVIRGREWANQAEDLQRLHGFSSAEMVQLARRVADAGGSYEDYRRALEKAGAAAADVRPDIEGLKPAFQAVGRGARNARDDVQSAMMSLPKTIRREKRAISAAAAEIRWALEHPLDKRQLANFYERKMNQAQAQLRKAMRQGNSSSGTSSRRWAA